VDFVDTQCNYDFAIVTVAWPILQICIVFYLGTLSVLSGLDVLDNQLVHVVIYRLVDLVRHVLQLVLPDPSAPEVRDSQQVLDIRELLGIPADLSALKQKSHTVQCRYRVGQNLECFRKYGL